MPQFPWAVWELYQTLVSWGDWLWRSVNVTARNNMAASGDERTSTNHNHDQTGPVSCITLTDCMSVKVVKLYLSSYVSVQTINNRGGAIKEKLATRYSSPYPSYWKVDRQWSRVSAELPPKTVRPHEDVGTVSYIYIYEYLNSGWNVFRRSLNSFNWRALTINNHRSSGFICLLRQCCFVWSEIVGPHSLSSKLRDECGPTISDHTKQHCRNKRSMITPEAWTPVIIYIYWRSFGGLRGRVLFCCKGHFKNYSASLYGK